MRTATKPRPARPAAPPLAPTVGRLVAVEAGRGVVETATGPTPARTTVPLAAADVGRDALVVFADGDRRAPVIVGLLDPAGPAPAGAAARVDGERLVFTAGREVVLECGEASITLTRAGKVLIRGTYVLTRSSGANRIKGASVQIN